MPDLGFGETTTLHGSQAFRYHRVPQAGETLTGQTTLTDAFERTGERTGRMVFAELTTEYRGEDGDPVVTEV